MPIFSIQAPDGKTYRVQGPNQAGAIEYLKSQLAANQSTQPSQPNYNPPGTGLGRAFQRGLYRTGQAFDLGSANIAANTLRGMDVDALETLKRSLNVHIGTKYPAALQSILQNDLPDLQYQEPEQFFRRIVRDYNLKPEIADRLLEDFSRIEAGKEEMRQPGGYFDQTEQAGVQALEAAQKKQQNIDALPMSPTAQRGAKDFQTSGEGWEGLKEWARRSFKDPVGALAFIGEIAAESTPSIAAGIGTSLLTGNPVAGAGVMILSGAPQSYSGEFVDFLREEGIDLSNAEEIGQALRNDDILNKASRRGITKAAIIGFFEAIGMKAGGGILRQTFAQSATGGGGEAASQLALDGKIDAKEVALEAVAETATVPGEVAIIKGRSLFTSDGKIQPDYNSLSTTEKQAGADVARLLREIATANGYNLRDTNVASEKGGKKALEAARKRIIDRLRELKKDAAIKPFLSPKQRKSLNQLLDDFAPADGAFRAANNKVSDRVTQDQFDAVMRLLPDSKEKQEIANLLRMSNQVTDLFNKGLKGGISQYTDYFNPFIKDGSYDPNRAANVIIGTGAGLTLGPVTTTGIVTGGRAFDFVTGRRAAAVDRFVRANEKKPGLDAPSGTSLIQSQADAEAAAQQRAEQEALLKDQRKAERKQTNQKLAQVNAPPTQGSPQDTLEVATGLKRENVAKILRILKARTDTSPILLRAIEGYEKSVGEGGKPPDLSPLIRAVRQFQRDNSSYSPLDFRPGDPDRVPLIDGQSPNRVNVDPTSPEQPQGGDEFGPQFTTPQNYNRGIEDNKAFRQDLEDRVLKNPDIKGDEEKRLLTSLIYLRDNLGSSPVPNALQEIQDLEDSGVVSQENIDTYIRPYVDRIIKQQRRNAPEQPTVQTDEEIQAEAEQFGKDITELFKSGRDEPTRESSALIDRLTMDFKDVTERIPELQEGQQKLQNEEITKEEYADLVNKYKPVVPYETTPEPATIDEATYALKNGKGQSEKKAKLFGIPSAILKLGQRIQLRLDIPSYSQHGTWVVSIHEPNSRPDSTAEGRFKAGKVVGYETVARVNNAEFGMLQKSAQQIASGSAKGTIATILGDYQPMSPSEAKSYVDNVLPQTLEPGSGWAQVGMDPERHSYFYDRNTMEPIVSADEVVQIGPLVVAKNPVYASSDNFRYSQSGSPLLDAMQETLAEPTRFQMGLPLFETPLPIEGKVTVKKIGEAMNQDHMEKVGRKLYPEQSDEDYTTVLDYARQELTEQLKQLNSGVGWYSKDVDNAMALASKVYPTLATNQEHRQLYLTFAGIFSNGTDPDNAFIMSSMAFDDFLRTGEIPTNRAEGFRQQGLEPPKTTFKSAKTGKMVTKDAGWGIRDAANQQQLGMLKYLVQREGSLKSAMEFLLTPQRRTDINDVMLDSGLYKAGRFTTKAEREGPDEYGFLAFGKKLGRYSLGLHGVEVDAGDTTIDLWYTRTYRRYTGRLLDTPIGKEGVAAQPANDQERDTIFRLTGDLVAENPDLTVGDVQALLWFFEKRTWGAQGLNTKEGTNSSGAKKLLRQRGIDPEQIDDGARGDGTGTQDSAAPEQPARFSVQQSLGVLSEADNNGPVQRSTPPSDAEVKQQYDLARAPLQIGKPGSKFENGIKDLDGIKYLADAYGITLTAYKTPRAMAKDFNTKGSGPGLSGIYSPTRVAAGYLSAGATRRDKTKVTPNQSFITALHEVTHGIAGSFLPDGTRATEDNITPLNTLNNRREPLRPGTFEAKISEFLELKDAEKNEIVKELIKLQDEVNFVFNDGEVKAVRDLAEVKSFYEKQKSIRHPSWAKHWRPLIAKHAKYIRGTYEISVDPALFYFFDPKEFKKVAPKTAKMMRDFFNSAGKVQFFSHPLAMGAAVVLAMLMKQEQAEEEEQRRRMMPPPGALNQPMQPGALSA